MFRRFVNSTTDLFFFFICILILPGSWIYFYIYKSVNFMKIGVLDIIECDETCQLIATRWLVWLAMIFSATFNNISVISWWSIYWWRKPQSCRKSLKIVSYKVVWSTPRHERGSNSQLRWWYAQVVVNSTTAPSQAYSRKQDGWRQRVWVIALCTIKIHKVKMKNLP